MDPSRSRLQTLQLAAAACLPLSCADPWELSWRLRFDPLQLARQAQAVEAEIRADGCDGRAVFSTRISGAGRSPAPGHLPPGRYGFHARARDRGCAWFAAGCEELELPHKGKIEVVLREADAGGRDPICIPPEDEDDSNAQAEEGGVEPADSGDARARPDATARADGRMPDRDIDADARRRPADAAVDRAVDSAEAPRDADPTPEAGAEEDGGELGFDPSAPKCQEFDDAVVACFDFENSLLDLSGRGNDADGRDATFEPGLSGSALRVGGKRVSVRDNDTLNFEVFTVELWVRSDGLANLTDEDDDRSVLLDKDAQYLLGHEPTGALRMQLYRNRNSAATTTAEQGLGLAPGVWTYVAYVYDGDRAALYKDGVRVHADALGVALSRGGGGPLHIGSGSPGLTRAFNGLIDAVRVSNVARDDSAICAAAGKRLVEERCE